MRSARSPSPSARRAHAEAVLGRDAVALEPGGEGLRRAGVEAHELAARGDRRQHLAGPIGEQHEVGEVGGSSSVLSIRLAAWSFIVSARSMTNTRRCASNGVRVAAATTGSSMSETSISAAPLGATQVRSGCAPERTRAAAPAGSAAPSASSAAASSRATSRLPLPAGPWKR